jgi:hypothetical protein
MDHKFDLLAARRGRLFALRLYLDMLIHELVGNRPGETQHFFSRLLAVRYAGMLSHFDLSDRLCAAPAGVPHGHIPTAQHVYSDSAGDRAIAASIFGRFAPETRDLLLDDYVEEISAQVGDRLSYEPIQ